MDLSQVFSICGIAFGLSMDAFAVAVMASVLLERITYRHLFRLAFHFGLFQAMMPVVGWAAGTSLEPAIRGWDHWIAFGLLAAIGTRAITNALRGKETDNKRDDPTRGLMLVGLSIATSIDALAVGMSFAMLRISITIPAVVIGLVACAMTFLGMLLGNRLGDRFGRRAELVGGLILIGIGLKIVLEHRIS